ncbi:MAG: hypothetical protein BEN18_10760 [Epulopiscium sp. Nuni2H_MBin001]|nr:MAG: hypothetical protein BEN18_10760 [Epulopiscium sp. Nuni2H_MBin001]
MEIIKHAQPLLGGTCDQEGVTFGIYASELQTIKLEIYNNINSDPIFTYTLQREEDSQGDFFYIKVSDITEGVYYTWSVIVEGKEHFLIDPYAYDVVKDDNGKFFNKVVKLSSNPTKRVHIPWEETIIYEVHVGHFTNHETAQVEARGTFEGMIEKLDYLKDLGITTIELLPIFLWNRNTLINRHPKTNELLTDIWGYNSISFFALDPVYMTSQADLRETFKKFVREVHDRGMEVVLDVVYNHTGEGGDGGPIFNFKALNRHGYYRHYYQYYANCSGTGNTLNTSHYLVQEMTLTSLRYWVVEMGVDGFRFDLASILGQNEDGNWSHESLIKKITEDPILSKVKLISESWDAKGRYDVGKMPYPFHEWSDIFRDCIRPFVKGDKGLINMVATCIVGKEISAQNNYSTCLPVHYITAHDGFTLWDLVSYNEKHNWDNGEKNRDGSNNNYSWNSGYEGETNDPYIFNLRIRRVKTFLGLLFLSKGIPMLVMGDEGARTQNGNNNAFCQDNDLVWLNWDRLGEFEDIADFIKKAVALRKSVHWYQIKSDDSLSWHGTRINDPDWSYFSRSIAWSIDEGNRQIYFVVNNYSQSLSFDLPNPRHGWRLYLDSASRTHDKSIPVQNNKYLVGEFSFCVLVDEEGNQMDRLPKGIDPTALEAAISKTIETIPSKEEFENTSIGTATIEEPAPNNNLDIKTFKSLNEKILKDI